jgi:hypothetical protein
MSIAIAALIAAAATIFALSGVFTSEGRAVLTVLLEQKLFSVNDAATALLYAVVTYLIVFSASLFLLRFLGLFGAALGLPNEEQIRRNREIDRVNAARAALDRRQARMIAHYITRSQDRSRRTQGARIGMGPLSSKDL